MVLTPDVVLRVTGFDVRWAEVLALVDLGQQAFALIDSNGDSGTGLESCVLRRDEHGLWEDAGSMAGDGSGYLGDVAYACGPGTPGSTIRVTYCGTPSEVTVHANGWWAFATRRGPHDDVPLVET